MNNNSEQDLRTPDEVEEDVLLPAQLSAFADEMDEILAQSKLEFEQAQELRFEEDILQLNSHYNKVVNCLTQIKVQINHILKLDEENFKTNELIISIIEMYENKYISKYTVSPEIHQNIFDILSNLRISCEDLELLKTIIIV